ncbi:MAG: TerC/Alx family metal homeostasis membrane protein [Myxococcaceae bacterium]
MGTPILWAAFLAGALIVIAIDLFASAGQEITPKKAAMWTAIWVSLSLGFAGFLHMEYGAAASGTFLMAYVIEYALSVDNLFVFIVIFSAFKVSNRAQHRLLYWGIIGAFILRGTLIGLGTALVSKFEWLLYFFGAFLLYTAWKLLFTKEDDDDEVVPEENPILKWGRKVFPVGTGTYELQFTAREAGKFVFTPLFLVLLVVEASDILFALDSIPAVLGISQDAFLVFTSNACAILGLRSLFFLVSSLMDKFRYLKIGLGIILSFVGAKLILETAFHEWAHEHEVIVIVVSLSVIVLSLAISIIASSLIKPKPEPAGAEAGEKAPEKA